MRYERNLTVTCGYTPCYTCGRTLATTAVEKARISRISLGIVDRGAAATTTATTVDASNNGDHLTADRLANLTMRQAAGAAAGAQ